MWQFARARAWCSASAIFFAHGNRCRPKPSLPDAQFSALPTAGERREKRTCSANSSQWHRRSPRSRASRPCRAFRDRSESPRINKAQRETEIFRCLPDKTEGSQGSPQTGKKPDPQKKQQFPRPYSRASLPFWKETEAEWLAIAALHGDCNDCRAILLSGAGNHTPRPKKSLKARRTNKGSRWRTVKFPYFLTERAC